MGYGEAPWIFKGRCLYQLQLVKADEARKYVPSKLKLVELFGYTLGGIYLARYEDSPVGAFEECVVMAGLVWNPPTSCAWAARVYVNNKEARDHGVASVGLPSRLAAFNQLSHRSSTAKDAWWQQRAPSAALTATSSSSSSSSSGGGGSSGGEVVELRNVQRGARGLADRAVALLSLPSVPAGGFRGPRLNLSLPSFSGSTMEFPSLLQYSCDLQTNIMPVSPMQVLLPERSSSRDQQQQQQQQHQHQQHWRQQQQRQRQRGKQQQHHPEVLDVLLTGQPLVCLAFSDMVMKVEEPQRLQLPATHTPAARQQAPPALHPAFAALVPTGNSSGAGNV